MSIPEAVARFSQELTQKCLSIIEQHTVPFYGVQNGQVVHDRTGVLYRVAGEYFILTAAHDLRGIISHSIPLFIPPVSDAGPVPLVNALFYATEEELGRDVAAIKLTADVATQLELGKKFLTHDRIGLVDDGAGLYVIFGYPMAWTERDASGLISSSPLIYLMHTYTGEKKVGSFFDGKVHIALQFDQDAVEVTHGQRELLPHIRGISGCGVWRVADLDSSGRGWKVLRAPRLVALQHRWAHHCPDYVQGTWVKHVLNLILWKHPDLRAAMSLAYPRAN